MNKPATLTLLLLLSGLALAMPLSVADDVVTLAVITRSDPYLVGIGEAKEVSAGRLINKSNISITVTAKWIQEEGPCFLPVTVVPKEMALEPMQDYEYYVVVGAPDEGFKGNYTGYVDIVAKPAVTVPGMSPTVPAGGLPLIFIVKHLRPAEFIVYNLTIDNATAIRNETRFASVSVKNVGEMTGTYNVIARVDGIVITTIPVTLAGDKVKNVDFQVPTAAAGNHSLCVDDCPDKIIYQVLVPKNPNDDKQTSVDLPLYTLLLTVLACCTMISGAGAVLHSKRKDGRHHEAA